MLVLVLLLVSGVGVGGFFLVKKLRRKPSKARASDWTPHVDPLGVAALGQQEEGNDMFELNDAARAAVKEAEGAPSQA